jgi:hypothetical protein
VTQGLDELQTVHDRHVPIEQDDIGHPLPALFEGDLPILGLVYLEAQASEQFSRDSPDGGRIIGDQT